MARRAQGTRAARAGLGRGIEPRRLRRNANKQALSRLELGDGLSLDSRSRLTATGSAVASAAQASKPMVALVDDLSVTPSDFRISQVTSTTALAGTTLGELQGLQEEIEVFLEEIRENFSTLTKRVNELSKRMS